MIGNDRASQSSPASEAELIQHMAFAEASMMLIETLMSLLIARNVLSGDDIIEAVEATIEAKKALEQEGEHPHVSRVAAGVLSTIANSIAAGAPRG